MPASHFQNRYLQSPVWHALWVPGQAQIHTSNSFYTLLNTTYTTAAAIIPQSVRSEASGVKLTGLRVLLTCSVDFDSLSNQLAVYLRDVGDADARGTGGSFGSIAPTTNYFGARLANQLHEWDISSALPSGIFGAEQYMLYVIIQLSGSDSTTQIRLLGLKAQYS